MIQYLSVHQMVWTPPKPSQTHAQVPGGLGPQFAVCALVIALL